MKPVIIQSQLPQSQFYKTAYPKKQIVLHHTVGGPNAKNTIHYWHTNSERVGTAFIIDREGIIFQAFDSQYWAHHLGTKQKNNRSLNQHSIGIELCCWGALSSKEDGFYTWYHSKIKSDEIMEYVPKFRGSRFFHKYTKNQIHSLEYLLRKLAKEYEIPLQVKPVKWDISEAALKGTPGIYTHIHYRRDKSDCHPQPELVAMLLSLNPNLID